jgi:hypothetical protein
MACRIPYWRGTGPDHTYRASRVRGERSSCGRVDGTSRERHFGGGATRERKGQAEAPRGSARSSVTNCAPPG